MVKFWMYFTDTTKMISIQMSVECEKKRRVKDDRVFSLSQKKDYIFIY